MKNREKYANEIIDIALSGDVIAVDKKNKPVNCSDIKKCEDCLLFKEERSCTFLVAEWAEQEYVEPTIDWTKVAVDTPVLVSRNGEFWKKGHFAGFIDGNVCTWLYGATSWSTDNRDKIPWVYAKLAEQEGK